MLIYLNALFNITELFKSELTKLAELEDIKTTKYIFIYSMLPELENHDLVNQTFESHLHNLDFEVIKLCIMCVTNKPTQVVKKYKSMTTTNKKLEEVHANLW